MKKHPIASLFLICGLVLSNTVLAQVTTPMVLGERDRLVIDLIKLSFEKSNYSQDIQPIDTYYSEARLVEEVKQNQVSVIWAGASNAMQQQLKPIKIPIFKGLLGHRVFVIEQSNQAAFEGVSSLESLKRLKAGLGRFWGDTEILENAGLEVVKPVKAQSLFHMVDGGRFDYLPLAVHEAWEVVETQNEVNLAVEDNILLIYPMAMYLYVDPQNRELYDAINNGLEAAIADGSYDQLFYQSPLISNTFKTARLNERQIIKINNPLLPADAPLHRKELWLDIQDR
ncbi:transporter substrate-binding domain-containing protein [Agarivorans sp. 1_MG-2023]|uniref:transporter substrate-binding domain-containing protein n=1 Tax=Agarivorans sp. 1_MG-2023 TaxID=3062634 RepID=UPI0026E1A7DE|nr:transporter substrate-binding domain-containing protein [Agarivorans sp. 1_MG-2023]MDO6762342.1 transporter substrate-binding domain-containing protein [Agarivorans sp. 1_MG-2023]